MTIAISRIQLSRALLTATDPRLLSEEVVRFFQREFETRSVTLFLISKQGLLVPEASAGAVPPEAENEAYRIGEDLVGRCVKGPADEVYGERILTRQPLIDTSSTFQRIFAGLIDPTSEIVYLPLNGVNRTYGVIRCIAGRLSDGTEKRFSPDELKDLDVYALQVGVAISSFRQRFEIDVLNRANKLLAADPQNVDAVYDLVTSALVRDATDFAACSIRIRDRRGDLQLESLSAAPGMSMVNKARASRRDDTGFAAEVFKRYEPVIVHNVQARHHEFHDPNWLRNNGIATAAFFPIYIEKDKIGVLALYLWYHYEFYDTQLEFLKNLCSQVATSTRVVQHLKARQMVVETTSAIVSQSGTAAELLRAILEGACDLTGAWQGYIALTSRRDGKLHPTAATPHLFADDIPFIDIEGKGLTALAVRTMAPVRRGNVHRDPDYVDFIGNASGKTISELVVPLVYQNHVLGVIALESDQIQHFEAHDELLLETLAKYATLIFQRDRLYEGTVTLAQIDFSRADRDRVLSVITKTAVELVDADAAILRTFNGDTNELILESYYPPMLNESEEIPVALPRGVGVSWDALRVKDVLKVTELAHNDRFVNRNLVFHNGFTDMVTVPLLLPAADAEHNTELGVINVFFRTPSPFFDVERQLLLALGVSASYAIHDLAILEKSNRAQALAAIIAQTTAAIELSSKLAQKALKPLREARLALDAISRSVRRRDLVGIPTPLGKLQTNISDLETLIARLVPKERVVTRTSDHVEVLSDAFRLMHTNLFARSGRPQLNIGEAELWEDITSALRRLIKLVHLPLGAAYISSHVDYSALRRVATTRGRTAAGIETITLPTYDEFAWLVDQSYVDLPRDDGYFAWLDPHTLTGMPKAVLYGHEVTGGRLMVIVFGLEKGRVLTFEDLATLYQSVVVQIFTYVDNAMFGIELDFLTSETGHMMGRAIGKVASGVSVLQDSLALSNTSNPTLVGLARSAVDDGLTRLRLIHNNFYWFSAQRRFLDSAFSTSPELQAEHVDVSVMLREMLPMFRREAEDRGLRSTRFENWEREAIVAGPEDLLRLVFLNLYDNALKFAYTMTFIDIRVRRETGYCVVSFENLGVGVASDEVKTVFERLRRSRYRDPARRVEGLGLGLAYCRRVVEEIFHGEISLASRPAELPKGQRFEGDNFLTTVTVKLPLVKEYDG